VGLAGFHLKASIGLPDDLHMAGTFDGTDRIDDVDFLGLQAHDAS
jgi:hypothetical protein